jgi:hypothetical protein
MLDLGRFFSFLIFYTICRTLWTEDQPVARPLPTHRTTQTQNKRTQTSIPRVGFEPTKPASERAKTVHALDGAATVIGRFSFTECKWTTYFNWIDVSENKVKSKVPDTEVLTGSFLMSKHHRVPVIHNHTCDFVFYLFICFLLIMCKVKFSTVLHTTSWTPSFCRYWVLLVPLFHVQRVFL